MKKELEKSEELKAVESAVASTGVLKLPDAIASKFTVAPGSVRVFIDAGNGGALVDLNRITLAQAESLAARGILIAK